MKTSTEQGVVSELFPLAVDDVSLIGTAITETAYAAKEADGVTLLILQGHLKNLCEVQLDLVRPLRAAGPNAEQVCVVSGGTGQSTKVLCPCGKELPNLMSVSMGSIDSGTDLVRVTAELGNVALG